MILPHLPLAEFTSKHEFLHQAQRRFSTVVHNRNWRDLAEELAEEGSAGSRSAPRGKRGKALAKGRERARHAAWREADRFVAVSQDGAGAFLNAIPMRDDMRMETWAMRISVQRRLGLPLDVACRAVAAGKQKSEQEDPRRVRRRCCQRAAAEPQHQTQVIFNASSSPYAPRGAPLCKWSRKATSVRVTTNNPTKTRATLARTASAFQAMSSLSAPSPMTIGRRSRGRRVVG